MNKRSESELRAMAHMLRWHAVDGTTVTAETLGRYADAIEAAVDYERAYGAGALSSQYDPAPVFRRCGLEALQGGS